MKKFFRNLFNALISFLSSLFHAITNKKMMITHGSVTVNSKSREGKILASTPVSEPPRALSLLMYHIGTQVIWALNPRNAERKAKLYPDQEIIGG